MHRLTSFVLALIPIASIIGIASISVGDDEDSVDRQSVSSARDLFNKAMLQYESRDDGALITLRNACRRYDEAVDGDPSDIGLFIERCRAKRMLAAKTDPLDGKVVDTSLEWLMREQARPGNWAFGHDRPAKDIDEDERDPDTVKATVIALLAMFGAGKSHREGRFQAEIEAALTFLVSEARVDVDGIDFRGPYGNTSTHALATMLLCEAYDVTDDPRLAGVAQKGVQFLESLQYPDTGGWGVVGDDGPHMVPTAWCVMALQSARGANLEVAPKTKQLIEKFLSSVQKEDGAFYGEILPGKEPKATAAGLLCRCLLGWTREQTALVKGAEYLAQPSTIGDDAEARFFATQVMFHTGGDAWRAWNRATRERLVVAQTRKQENLGSWYFDQDVTAKSHGRLWHTGLSCLTLEVYYRYLTVFKTANLHGLVELRSDDAE